MDIVAHTLWAAAGATVIHRRRPLTRGTVLVTLVLAALAMSLSSASVIGNALRLRGATLNAT